MTPETQLLLQSCIRKEDGRVAILFFVRYRWYSNSRSYILTMSPS